MLMHVPTPNNAQSLLRFSWDWFSAFLLEGKKNREADGSLRENNRTVYGKHSMLIPLMLAWIILWTLPKIKALQQNMFTSPSTTDVPSATAHSVRSLPGQDTVKHAVRATMRKSTFLLLSVIIMYPPYKTSCRFQLAIKHKGHVDYKEILNYWKYLQRPISPHLHNQSCRDLWYTPLFLIWLLQKKTTWEWSIYDADLRS